MLDKYDMTPWLSAEPVELIEIGYPQALAVLLKSGANSFEPRADGLHNCVVKAHPDAFYVEEVNRALQV